MSGSSSSPVLCPIHLLADQMESVVHAVIKQADAPIHEGGDGAPIVLRASVPIQVVPPLDWMAGHEDDLRFYGSTRDRQQALEIGGVGVADEAFWPTPVDYATVFDRLHATLSVSQRGLRYYGGFRFDASRPTDADWDRFGFSRFVIPRYELITSPQASLFSLHFTPAEAKADRVQGFVDAIARMRFDVRHWDDRFPPPRQRRDNPDQDGWRHNVESALNDFRKGDLQKMVLARKAEFSFGDRLDPVTLLHRLKSATPECFHFCYMPSPDVAFVGASPERLYRREDRDLETEAVAGTRMRSANVDEDRRLGDELLGSDKDNREHAFVRDGIAAAIQPLCAGVDAPTAPKLLKLARGQHLYTPIRGQLKPDVTDAQVLSALHPTPALGGTPTAAALKRIATLESFDRGWYAAPAGWVSADAAEFAVAIRSGLVFPDRLALFSGAGIVEGSTPESEWEEIELKIRDFIKVLTDA